MSSYERSPRPADDVAGESAGTSDERRSPSARHEQPTTEPNLLARVPDLDTRSRGRFDKEPSRSSARKSLGQRLSMSILVGGALLLLIVAAGSWLFGSKNSGDSAKWGPENPAPDAPVAPAWSGSGVSDTATTQSANVGAPDSINPVIPAIPSYGGVPMDPAAQAVPAAPQWNSGPLPSYPTTSQPGVPATADPANQAWSAPATPPAWTDPPAGTWPQPVDVNNPNAMRVIAPPPAASQAAQGAGGSTAYEPVYQAARPNPGYYADFGAAAAHPQPATDASLYPQTSPTTYPSYDPASQAYVSPNQQTSYAAPDYSRVPAATAPATGNAPGGVPGYQVPVPATSVPGYFAPGQPGYTAPAQGTSYPAAPQATPAAPYGQTATPPYGATPATYSAPASYQPVTPVAYPAATYNPSATAAYPQDARLQGTIQTPNGGTTGTPYDSAGSSLR